MRSLIIISFLFMISCGNETSVEGSGNREITEDTLETEIDSLDYFIEQWTWGEELEDPDSSNISNFPFTREHLFRTWTSANFAPSDSILSFDKDYVTIHTENNKYKYTINYDSLRIFTSYEIVGAKRTKGIIKDLNQDKMIILWSDYTEVQEWTPTKE